MSHAANYAPTSRINHRGVWIRITGDAMWAHYRLENEGGGLLAD